VVKSNFWGKKRSGSEYKRKVLQRRYLQQNKKGKTIETAETDTNNEQLVADSEFGGGCEGIVCPH